MAADKAQEILDEMADRVTIEDDQLLRKIAMTAVTGKKAESAREELADLTVEAVKRIADKADGGYEVDIDYIGVEKRAGGSIEESELVSGVIIDKEVVHPGMPKAVKNAKIALLDAALEVKKTETDAEIRVTRPEQLRAFLDEEEKMLHKMVDTVVSTGANVLLCQKGIDDIAQHYLAKAGILAARRGKKSDMEKLARATGGKVVMSIEDLSSAEIGRAGIVEERKIGDEKLIFVEKCKDPKAVGLLIRGGSEHVVDELERSIHDALSVVSAAIEDNKVVCGGGAPEMQLARRIRKYAESVGGREALAVSAFADAVESIPKTLAENAGLDSIDVLVDLRSKHEKPDGKNFGIDAYSGKVGNMAKLNVFEPLRIKTQAIKSASETAIMILRIDDVITATKKEMAPPKAPEEGEEAGEE